MADNTILSPGVGGDVVRDKDRAGVKTQIVALDLNPAGVESLMAGTIPVSNASLPLPAGASTEVTIAAVLAKIIAAPATDASLAAVLAKLSADPATQTTLAAVLAKLNGTVAVSNVSLPLPAGASTEVTVAKSIAGSTPTASAAAATNVALVAGAQRLLGFSARETAGTAAVFRLRDGSAGTIVSTVSLAASESVRDWFGPQGVACGTSVYLERVSGTTEVSVLTA